MAFPTFINWLSDNGIENLRAEICEETDIDNYCDTKYRAEKNAWNIRMNDVVEMSLTLNDDNPVEFEMAKVVLVEIINSNKEQVKEIIENEDLAPDHSCAEQILSEYNNNIIPKLEEYLRFLDGF